MHERLFAYPATLARYRRAPLLAERERFLIRCATQDYAQAGLKKIAWQLLVVVHSTLSNKRWVTRAEIERVACRHRVRFLRHKSDRGNRTSTQQLFIHTATAWFDFLGRLAPDPVPSSPFGQYVQVFERFMREEQGLSACTIATRIERVGAFLTALPQDVRSLHRVTVCHIDSYLIRQNNRGWTRRSMGSLASSLRSFFRFAEAQRWCRAGITEAIECPRIYADEGLPRGPDWSLVQRLIASTAGDDPTSIRDRAVLMLLALYGLRRGEVAHLHVEDLDWDAGTIRIVRPKQRRAQHYPLIRPVADALARYVREVRVRCTDREVFLAMKAPTRPISPAGISGIVRYRLAALGVQISPSGSHSLRHACARHLLAEGFSFKQIGDQLGHRCTSTTLHYAKVDLNGLRLVAELSLGRIL
jgi:site-specific recombinase XerD